MQVKEILDKEDVWYKIRHFPKGAKKSGQVSKLLPDYIDDVVKTIIMKVGEEFIAFCLLKDDLVDYRKLRNIFNADRIRMANAEEVLEHSNSPPGGCCPLLVDCSVYLDPKVKETKKVSMGSGSVDHSLEMETKDLIRLTNPKILDISVPKSEK